MREGNVREPTVRAGDMLVDGRRKCGPQAHPTMTCQTPAMLPRFDRTRTITTEGRDALGLIDRLSQWSEIQKVRAAKEPPDLAGGRDGELLLRQLVGSSFRFKDAHLLAGRRIPSQRQGRRREIDLIVCTPQMIHLIEVKNWSGQLTVQDNVWRQTRWGGNVVEHGDLIRENLLKRDAVVEYLHDRGLGLDEEFVREHIVPKVIFTNPKLELGPEIEGRPDVISRKELDGYLGRQRPKGLAERMFSSLIEFCLDSESKLRGVVTQGHRGRIPSGQYERIVACLSETETWDQLHFYGTNVVMGDVVSLRVGPKTYRKPELVEVSEELPIRLKWTRSRFWGLGKAVTGLGSLGSLYLGKSRVEVSTADTVMFHAVGDAESRTRRLVEVDRIVLG
jgi:Nuclease-related domain